MSESGYPDYITDKLGELPFCPGCGHTTLLKALNKAFVKLQPDPAKLVLVTDIGCIGLSCRYFITSAFHGLHGRSITYACGLKLARPELTVLTLMGDGGCGIGGTHLLNVARRNIGIKLIVANNFNYGMTGGQHSVTTPIDGLTSTTPGGNIEAPMDLCATAAAAGASWVYRATVFDRELPDVMAKLLMQPGFAMLDVWELCSAYYSEYNDLKKRELLALSDGLGFGLGLQADRPRPEYSARYREAVKEEGGIPRKRPPIEPRFTHTLSRQTGIVIAGSAGQKVKSAATLFAEAAIYAGLHATQKDDYPITVQTGHSVTEIIASPERIDYTGIESPDLLVLISDDGLKRVRTQIENLPANARVYAEESLALPSTKATVRRYPFARIAKQVSRLSVAIAAFSAVLRDTSMFPPEALATAIRTFQKASIAEINLKALEAGSDLNPIG
jgi:pyruvate/2-oxoacid:ferredoxin oxidoreductase beta subunit/Pyruvate/2-oxoacid:ferredoxin oxidoreductase gamma subunit